MILLRHRYQKLWGRNTCGQSAATMLINALKQTDYTVKQVATATKTDKGLFTPFFGYTRKSDGVYIPGLYQIFTHYGLKSGHRGPYSKEGRADLAWWKAHLAAGGLGIALVDYRQYSDNPPVGWPEEYLYAHFLIPLEIGDVFTLVHDPLQVNGPTLMPTEEFELSINTPSPTVGGTNFIHQGMWVSL